MYIDIAYKTICKKILVSKYLSIANPSVPVKRQHEKLLGQRELYIIKRTRLGDGWAGPSRVLDVNERVRKIFHCVVYM